MRALRTTLVALLLVLGSAAHAQECRWEYDDLGRPEPLLDFVAVHHALNVYLFEGSDLGVPPPADDAAARAALCSDGGVCAGVGPWLVFLSRPDLPFTDYASAIVMREAGRLHVVYRWGNRDTVCGPLSGTIDRDAGRWVSRLTVSVDHGTGCTPWTSELHMLVDVPRRRIAGTAVRTLVPGERSTLSYRTRGEGHVVSCGSDERVGPAVPWMRWDGEPVE